MIKKIAVGGRHTSQLKARQMSGAHRWVASCIVWTLGGNRSTALVYTDDLPTKGGSPFASSLFQQMTTDHLPPESQRVQPEHTQIVWPDLHACQRLLWLPVLDNVLTDLLPCWMLLLVDSYCCKLL